MIENARLLGELRELNQVLEQRIADQVGETERLGRLRRFLPPQVADLIVASGSGQVVAIRYPVRYWAIANLASQYSTMAFNPWAVISRRPARRW